MNWKQKNDINFGDDKKDGFSRRAKIVTELLDDFFVRAMIGGIGAAIVAGPVGCFVVWRRMSYFGTTLAHSVLLGVALGFLLDIELIFAVFIVCMLVSSFLLLLERQRYLSVDALLGVLAHAVFAAGIVVVSFMETLRIDLMGYLFGDILSVSQTDITWIFVTAAISLGLLIWYWRSLLSFTVDQDLAAVEGVPVNYMRALVVLLVSGVVAVGMKIVGILLVVSLIIIPAASARRMSVTPEQMAIMAAIVGVISVVLGLFSSLEFDVPAGPAISLAATAIFALSFIIPTRFISR